jgi:hypothetical protein
MESEIFEQALPCLNLYIQVATMRYIAECTSVPVPEIYAWNFDASNAVGAEYMIMEKVSFRLFSQPLLFYCIQGDGMSCT